ncbi:MAG: tape measure protein [Sphingorhabdus sp.]
MTASLLIKARETGFDRIAAKARNMVRGFQPVARAADAAGRAINRIEDGAAAKFARIGRGALRMAREFKVAERAAYGLGRGIGWTIRKSGELIASAAKWGAVAAGAAVGAFVGGVIKTGAQFEQFQAQLEGTEGSAAKAKAALAWVAKFAEETPYKIDQVTDAFARARGLQIDPTNGSLKSMGDAASANRKTLMEAVEAIADAQQFGFERLKEFNITASTMGNKVKLSYIDKDGKSAFKEVKKDALEVQKAVLAIWDSKHAGAMLRQSRTLDGIWSNIEDKATGFMLKVYESGFGEKLKGSLSQVLSWMNKIAADGTLDNWAKRISAELERAVDWAKRFTIGTDWGAVARELGNVARAGGQVISFLATAVRWAVSLKRGIEDAAAAWTLLNGTPIGKANAAAYFQQQAATQRNREAIDRWERGTGKPARQPAPSTGDDWLGKLKPRKVSSRADIGGSLDIRIKTDRGTTASVERMSAKDKRVPLNVGTVRASV